MTSIPTKLLRDPFHRVGAGVVSTTDTVNTVPIIDNDVCIVSFEW